MQFKLLSVLLSSILISVSLIGCTTPNTSLKNQPDMDKYSDKEDVQKDTEKTPTNKDDDKTSTIDKNPSSTTEDNDTTVEKQPDTVTPSEPKTTNPPSNDNTAKEPVTPKTPTTPPAPAPAPTPKAPVEKEPAPPKTEQPKNTPTGLPAIPKNYSVEFLTSVENQVLQLCNAERQKAGLGALTMDETMRNAARYKAEEMLQYGYFDHNSPYVGSPFDLLTKFGVKYGAAAENIQTSTGYNKASVTAKYLVDNWMNSPGHRANIMNGSFKRMGIGVAFTANGNIAYESQLFAD